MLKPVWTAQRERDDVRDDVIDLTGPPQRPRAAATYDVAIVGLGYVGLPTALAFTHAGRTVLGYDLSDDRLGAIERGEVDLLDDDRDRLGEALEQGAIELTSSPSSLGRAHLVLVCVPTPVDHQLTPDLTLLRAACATVVEHARPGQVLVLTSTSYVGSTRDLLVAPLERRGFRVGLDLHVAFSPERIDPGNAEHAHEVVPRVVGGVTATCADMAETALGGYARSIHRVSSPEAAEATKLYENTFRAVNIALANEMADIAHGLDLDIAEVIDAAATKPYGFMKFTPGPGVGGHCIPCDPHYLLWQLRQDRRPAPLVEQAMWSIAQRPRRVVERVHELLAVQHRIPREARVLVVGVAYKPGVADVRESPSLEIIERLVREGACVDYVDPLVPHVRLEDGSVLRSLDTAPEQDFDLVVVTTVHPDVDYGWLAREGTTVLDTTYRLRSLPDRAVL